ncbi:unnamed protein product [Alternaria alternata]
MDSYNLKTASTYINNLLLARGLLRNGKPIEFAHPSRGEGGKEATMAQIINLVHDLILKRDRDQEYRESIADTLRNLRSESTRQTAALEKQHNRNADLSRQLSLAQAQEQSARKALHTAESSARKLRAEMQRLKTTVDQIRASCTNDVQKRDKEIARLKSQLDEPAAGQQDWACLKQETTEFLTHLSQSLSDENDNLIGLRAKHSIDTEGATRHAGKESSVVGDDEDDARQDMLHALPTDYETLADDMDTVLDNLKNLLTNPNFVAAGKKMEARLRESFILMDSWRKHMTNGDTINLDELRMGLGFGEGFEMVDREGFSTIQEESEADDAASSALEEDVDDTEEREEEDELPSPAPHEQPDKTTGPDIFRIKLQPSQTALRESNGNKPPIRSPRKVAFSASIPNTPSQLDEENAGASEIDLVEVEKTMVLRPLQPNNQDLKNEHLDE